MGLIRKWGAKAAQPTNADNNKNADTEVPIMMASDMCDIGRLAYPSQIHGSFGVAKDLVSAAALSMGAGMDQELCNPTDSRGQAFPLAADAVKAGACVYSVRVVCAWLVYSVCASFNFYSPLF